MLTNSIGRLGAPPIAVATDPRRLYPPFLATPTPRVSQEATRAPRATIARRLLRSTTGSAARLRARGGGRQGLRRPDSAAI
jgi:hypothetical protein